MVQHILLNITSYCNALCEFCIVYDSLNKPEGNMSDEQIFSALRKGREEGATGVGYSGGEPTLHARMAEIIRYARELGYKTQSMNTNGIKFKKFDYCRELVDAGLTDIDFSIHGADPEVHNRLVNRKGAYEAIEQAAENLVELQKTYDFRMSATTVITRDNHTKMLEIVTALHEMGFGNKRLKYAYEGDLRIEAVRDQVAPYEACVPSVQEALEYLSDKHEGFHLTHIPLCILGDHAAFSSDFTHMSTRMVGARDAEEGEPAHRFRKDSDTCSECVLSNLCTRLDGKYEEHHGRPDLRAFKTISEVDEMFDRAKQRFGPAASIISYTQRAFHQNVARVNPEVAPVVLEDCV
jgi:organic radical activating enzyme